MKNNYRYQYYCRGVNIKPQSGDTRLISSHLLSNPFIRGVQSFEANAEIPAIQITGLSELQIMGSRRSMDINLSRVISKSGDFFIKKDVPLANEIYSNNSSVSAFDIISIYGDENESYLSEESVNLAHSYRNCYINSLEYNLGISSPSIKENISFTGTDVEVDQEIIGPIELPIFDSVELFNRKHFSPTHADINPSILPEIVTEIIDHHQNQGIKFTGLQDINISIEIPNYELKDVGTWNLNDRSKFIFHSFPLKVVTEFSINIKREVLDKYMLISTPELEDQTIHIVYGDFMFNLGGKNKIESISKSGGSTDGSIEQISLRYVNFNAFQIKGLLND